MQPIPSHSRRLASLTGSVLIFALTLAVFWPTRHFEFTNYDDPGYITENPAVQAGLTLAGVRWAFLTSYYDYWHPLTWLSHMLDCQVFGLQAGWHHLSSTVLHALNAVLLFVVLARLTGKLERAGVVAMLFALHPLHVESVAWLAERKDLLSTLFWLLTIWAYARYVEAPSWGRHALVLLLFAAGLMSKPMVVTLPLTLLLLDFWPLRRMKVPAALDETPSAAPLDPPAVAPSAAQPQPVLRLVAEKLPMLGLALGAALITLLGVHRGGNILSTDTLPVSLRLANVPISYVRYLGKTVLPENLAVLYPMPERWQTWEVLGACILLLLISLPVLAFAPRRRYLLFGWLWFGLTLLPTIGLIPVGLQSMADRYTYVPLIGLFIMAVWAVGDLSRHWPARNAILRSATTLLLVGCAIATQQQLRHWRNSETLFSHTLNVTTNNYLAHYNLGQTLMVKGRTEPAMSHYREALRINPDYERAHNNLGSMLLSMGRTDEAIDHFQKALELAPKLAQARLGLALCLAKQGRNNEAVVDYRKALELAPNNAHAHLHLGHALVALGQDEEAVQHYARAVGLNPKSFEAQLALGRTLASLGRTSEALIPLETAVSLDPNASYAHTQLGAARLAQNEPGEAIRNLRRALQLNPNDAQALQVLAWILATDPQAENRNGLEALALARRACELSRTPSSQALRSLAVAYAETGAFEAAAQTARQAMDLDEQTGESRWGERNQELRSRFENGEPYRRPEIR